MNETESEFDHVKIVCDLIEILNDQKVRVLPKIKEDGFEIIVTDSEFSPICHLIYLPYSKKMEINNWAELDIKTIYALSHYADRYSLEKIFHEDDDDDEMPNRWDFSLN